MSLDFNPNGTGTLNSGLFALPDNSDDSALHIIPVPWDVTTSFQRGTHKGPQSILESSRQLDLCLPWMKDFFDRGIYLEKSSADIVKQNKLYSKFASRIQSRLESGQKLNEELFILQKEVNASCEKVMNWVEEQCSTLIERGKLVGVVGGDHSSPLGLIRALQKKWGSLSILHIDAHMDLRQAYQGFKYSHASIMRNVIEESDNCQIIQVGIRDYCPEERQFANESPQVQSHFASDLFEKLFSGQTWFSICDDIISSLGDNVYISFDIDGLDPSHCPNTGTPVPGGLSYQQCQGLFQNLHKHQKKIVGFDLCEVAPQGDVMMGLDGNVGARVLYSLSGLCLHSNL